MSDLSVVLAPELPRGALRGWRRLVTRRSGDADKHGAFALYGPPLGLGLWYEVPPGAVIVSCDVYCEVRVTCMYTALPGGGLERVKDWTTAGPLGDRVVGYVARRLAEGARDHAAALVDAGDGRWLPGLCRYCGSPVPAASGIVQRNPRYGDRYAHPKGSCPPRPLLPVREEPSLYGGPCAKCGNTTEAETGAAVLHDVVLPGSKARYAPVHQPRDCGEPLPGPRNPWPGWCAACTRHLDVGEGCWLPAAGGGARPILAHWPSCGGERDPEWAVKVPDGARSVSAGQVIRARVALADGGPLVPADAPGYQVLDADRDAVYVEFTAVVTGTESPPYGLSRARVRAATAEEALALDPGPEVSPAGPGYRASWEKERIGEKKPWVAELTGWSARFGFERKFLRAKEDWEKANSKGTRGVRCYFTLELDKVYEAWWMESWHDHHRAFLRATPEGDVTEIGREEAEAWLRAQHVS